MLIMLAVVLLGSIGAFFLFVAILPMLAIVAVLIGLATMFGLGFYVGQNPSPSRFYLRMWTPSRPIRTNPLR